MYCKECGAEIEDGKFCSECGTNINSTKKKEGSEKKETKKLKDWQSAVILLVIPAILYYFVNPIIAGIVFVLAVIYVIYDDRKSKKT